MIEKEKQVLLAKYRLQEAKESIEEAEYLFSGNKSPRSVMNRVYYGMFYAVLALIIFEKFISSKHTGVLSFFNKQFIKEGVFPKEMGRWINTAFDLRQIGDYREYVKLTRKKGTGKNVTKITLINPKFEYRNPKQYQNSNFQNSKQKPRTGCCCCFCFGHLNFGYLNLFRISDFVLRIYS